MSKDVYLDDVQVGDEMQGGPIAVTLADVVAFAQAYDPQPMHTDAEAAASGPFGGLIASGWHVASLVMREFVLARPWGSTPMVGMGVDELRWLVPVRPGDTLRVRRTVIEVTRSATRPRGVLKSRLEVTNQHGVTVMTMTTLASMPTRSGTATPSP